VDQNTVKTDQNNINSVLSDPTKASSADTAAFQQQLNANYGGPTDANSYAGFTNAQNEAQNAYNQAQQANTEGGKMALLNKYFGTPTYTSGQQSLDSALLTDGDQTPFTQLTQQVQNYPSQFQSAAQDLNNYAAQGAQTTAATNAAARSALGVDASGNLVPQGIAVDASGTPLYTGALGNIINGVNQRVDTYNANAQPTFSAVQQALTNKNLSSLTPDELAALGGISNYTGALYGANPSQFLTQNAANATPNTAITADEQAKLQALFNLAGVKDTFAPDASLAGTASTNPFTFNNNAFQAAIQSGKDAYQGQLNQQIQYADPLAASPGNGSLGVGSGVATSDLPTAIANTQRDLALAQSGQINPSYNQADLVAQLSSTLAGLKNQFSRLGQSYGANDYLNQPSGGTFVPGTGSHGGGMIRG
jgi:hypothetical protein